MKIGKYEYDFDDVFTLASLVSALSYYYEESICNILLAGTKDEILEDLFNAGIIKNEDKDKIKTISNELEFPAFDSFGDIAIAMNIDENLMLSSYAIAIHFSNRPEYKNRLIEHVEKVIKESSERWDEKYDQFTEKEKKWCLDYKYEEYKEL